MAQAGSLFVKGAVQEEIESELNQLNRDGGIPFYQSYHRIRLPEYNGFFLSGFVPSHGAISIVKRIDDTSIKLMRSLCYCESLLEVELLWYSMRNGIEEVFFSIFLQNCRFVGFQSETDAWGQLPNEKNTRDVAPSEKFDIFYDTIRWQKPNAEGVTEEFDFDNRSAIKNQGSLYY